MQAAARRPPSAPATTPGAPAPRSPTAASRFGSASTLATTGTRGSRRRQRAQLRAPAGPRPASSARSGTARSPAAERRAWRPAPSRARPRAPPPPSRPAITTWPGQFRFAGLTTSPSRRLRARLRHRRRVEAQDRRHRALPDRHGLLHVAAAPPHHPHARRRRRSCPAHTCAEYSPRLWPATNAGSKPRDASSRHAATLTVRIAGCVFSVSRSWSSGPSKHRRLSGSPSASSASANVSRQTSNASASALPMPTACDPVPER